MEVVYPEPPPGQQFILRRHLREVFLRSAFEGESCEACVGAFLAPPGVPLLMQNGVSQAPAASFLNLFTTREPTYPPEGEGRWYEDDLRRRLAELGDHRLTQLIATHATRSWAIYLNESLDEVLAFHGRTLPGPRHTVEDDEADLLEPTLIRHLPVDVAGMRPVRLDHSKVGSPRVALIDATGHGYELRFTGFHRLRTSSPSDAAIRLIDEIRGPSGRTWFIFDPVDQTTQRKLAVLADSAEWVETLNAADRPRQATGE
ncbi:MAG: hypothetical protein E6J20_02640 [Chloroflexi bacterium]|nr:MAG: hypothetical protein E6J20_02640 [Chloroflexota bacterium]